MGPAWEGKWVLEGFCLGPDHTRPGPLCVQPVGQGEKEGLATCPRPETTWLDLTSHLPRGTPGLLGLTGSKFQDVCAPHHSESKADIWEGSAAGEGHWGLGSYFPNFTGLLDPWGEPGVPSRLYP